MGDHGAATDYFKAAVRHNDRMGAIPAAIRSRLELARTMQFEGCDVLERLDEVIHLARLKGMQRIVRQAQELSSYHWMDSARLAQSGA